MADTDGSGFGKFVPGFEFMQNLARQAAGGIAQGVQQSVPQLPSLNSWVAPTFSVEELEKRIAELKAVQFWLDQNARALSATVQALEVQKMTLATLQGMNVNLGDVANALKVRATDTMASMAGMAGLTAEAPKEPTRFKGLEVPPRTGAAPSAASAPTPAPAPAPAPKKSTAAKAPATPASAVVDPMLWWGSLSQQFQNIATQAMKDVATQAALDTSRNVAASLTREAVKTATQAATAVAQTAVQAGSGLVGAGVRAASTGAKVARKAATPAATAASAVAAKAAAKAPTAGHAGGKTTAKSAAKSGAKPAAKATAKAAGTPRTRSR